MSEQSLKDRILSMIRAQGPISVATYMDICLHDSQQGYYATRPGLGHDFITAPEISQIFGELLGLWAAYEWNQMGAPSRLTLCEVGPGRGTLICDALRAATNTPGFSAAIDLHLIEPSPALQGNLRERLAQYRPTFVQDLNELPADQPILILANEWLDCLPARQFQRTGESWHERMIGADPEGNLTLGLASDAADASRFPANSRVEAFELQPGLETLSATLASLFSKTTGRALLIDYGDAMRAPTDTLRAFRNGVQMSPFEIPGESDLTVDVDFGRLRRLAHGARLSVAGPVPQGGFLMSLGAETRLNQLTRANPAEANELYDGLRRLVDPEDMGTRFNAICISSEGLPEPAGF